MSVHALALASFVWGVDGDCVLAATYREDGALVAVINRGIEGCPKYILPEARVLVELGRRSKAISDELRGTFGSDGIAHNAPEDGGDTPDAISATKSKGRTKKAVKHASDSRAV